MTVNQQTKRLNELKLDTGPSLRSLRRLLAGGNAKGDAMKATLTQLSHGLGIETAPQQKETMKTKHTPGQLEIVPRQFLDSELLGYNLRIADAGDHIGQILQFHNGSRTEANANRLALCWNCHDELVEALQNAANVLAGLATGQLKAITPDSLALKQVRAALRKAGIEL